MIYDDKWQKIYQYSSIILVLFGALKGFKPIRISVHILTLESLHKN